MKHLKSFFAVLLLLSVNMVFAKTENTNATDEPPILYFVVWTHNDEKVAYLLSEHPVVTYSEGELLLSTLQQEVFYTASDVHKFTFSTSDITGEGQLPPTTEVLCLEQELELALQQGDVLFMGSCAGSEISVYTIDGMLLHTVIVDATCCVHLEMSSYPSGVYVIKTEKTTHKIIKK